MKPQGEGAMTPQRKVRRACILCLHCLNNIAFLRVTTYRLPQLGRKFLGIVNNNFIDIAILEWCKLFSDKKGKHHWAKTVIEKDQFTKDLCTHLKCTIEDFDKYTSETKQYRDRFIAHLDNQNTMTIPNLDIAKNSCIFLYEYLLEQERKKNSNHLEKYPQSITDYYDEKTREAIAYFDS